MENPYYANEQGILTSPEAPSIFQQFAFSFVPSRYKRLTQVKVRSMIAFVTLLALFATVLSLITHLVGFAAIDMNTLADQLPDFTIMDGHLSLEEDFQYEKDGMFVYITDDVEGFSYGDAVEKAAEGYLDIFLVGRDMICIMQNRGRLQYQYIGFELLGRNKQLSKDMALDALKPFVTGLVVVYYILIFVGRALGYFVCAAVYLLFAMLISSIMKKRQTPAALFRTAVYVKVPMFVIATLLAETPFLHIAVPFLLRVVITMVFMGFSIAKLADDRPAPMNMGPETGQGWQ